MIDVLSRIADSELEAHSFLALTYGVSLPLYDGLVRRQLRAVGVNNQVIACDLTPYARELDAISATRAFGRDYSVTPVDHAHSFHPKLYLLLGRVRGRLIVGSGNATYGGLLRNAELFGEFNFNATSGGGPHEAFGTAVALIREALKASGVHAKAQLDRALSSTPWLTRTPTNDGRLLLVGGPGRAPLLNQMLDLLPGQPKSVTVVSAFFDRKLAGLEALAAATTSGKLTCVLQQDTANIDGAAVKSLGKTVAWRNFEDPLPKEKRERRDALNHSKLYIWNLGDVEVPIFGSANASAPALLRPDNTEILVALAPRKAGSTAKALNLDASVDGPECRAGLAEKQWKQDEATEALACGLVAAEPAATGVRLVISRGTPPKGARVELCEGAARTERLVGELKSVDGDYLCPLKDIPATLNVVRLVTATGAQLSNWVGLTRAEVATGSLVRGLGRRAEAALAAMQDGQLLGTLLFDLLSTSPELPVVLAGGGGRATEAATEQPVKDEPRERDSFYSDGAQSSAPAAWHGDRLDIDLLASLVQPLRRSGAVEVGDDDDADDAALDEEAESRLVDAQKGKATGAERAKAAPGASSASYARARDRLTRRLFRSSGAVHDILEQLKNVVAASPRALSQQLWMVHIGAYLAGRKVVASDDEEVECLDPFEFAAYVMRLAHGLAGGRAGGVLSKVPTQAWDGRDGETLKRGLSFLWTCTQWATEYLLRFWEDDVDDEYVAEEISEAAPELVAARFALVVRELCEAPDEDDLARKFPAMTEAEPKALTSVKKRIERLATAMTSAESGQLKQSPLGSTEAGRGSLVLNAFTGLTMLAAAPANGKCKLVDLSAPRNSFRTYKATHVFGVVGQPSKIHCQELEEP